MGQVVTIGLDLAKSVFQAHGVESGARSWSGASCGDLSSWLSSPAWRESGAACAMTSRWGRRAYPHRVQLFASFRGRTPHHRGALERSLVLRAASGQASGNDRSSSSSGGSSPGSAARAPGAETCSRN